MFHLPFPKVSTVFLASKLIWNEKKKPIPSKTHFAVVFELFFIIPRQHWNVHPRSIVSA